MSEKGFGAGSLFSGKAHTEFLSLSGSRYDAMMARLERKKLIDVGRPPFSKAQFREHLLAAMGGQEDGFVKCRFCGGFFGLADISADHEIPLSRGGSVNLDNIGYPCQRCNRAKGGTNPTEFLALLHFLETEIPEARLDVLDRLEKAVGFMQTARLNSAVIGTLKKDGTWQKAQKERREIKKAKEHGKF